MGGVVHIPWYATVFRGDQMQEALEEIAPVARRYGATEYAVYRSRDDRYKFLQLATFEDKLGWDAYWYGPEFNEWRAEHAGWFQVPIVYAWHDLVAYGETQVEESAEVSPSNGS